MFIKRIFIISVCLLLLFHVKSQNEKFVDFIEKFTNDSLFQINRVSFPLPYQTWNLETDEEVISYIPKNKYKFNRLYYFLIDKIDSYPMFYDNFKCEIKDSDEMVFRWVGFSDMDDRYYFKRKNGLWYLIKISSNDALE
jgi:hypothetical protein